MHYSNVNAAIIVGTEQSHAPTCSASGYTDVYMTLSASKSGHYIPPQHPHLLFQSTFKKHISTL